MSGPGQLRRVRFSDVWPDLGRCPVFGRLISRDHGALRLAWGVQFPAVMPTYNVQADLLTGDICVVGKDGRRYTLDELEDAERRARAGDRAAQALLGQVDLSRDADGNTVATREAVAVAQRTIAAAPPLPDGGGCRAPP